jgi:UTP-glucose-1-phosphate uridylyltransferase
MKPTLLVLAAGMGSRYGGLKQLDGVGPSGETILEYSVYDAIRAGYGKIVFVIRAEFAADFEAQVASKFANQIPVAYVHQTLDMLPPGFSVPPQRQKPWGTGQAILITEAVIKEPFVAINADDFYGADSFQRLGDHLTTLTDLTVTDYAMVGYTLRNTLSEHGSVARGICQQDGEYLQSIIERTQIEKVGNGATFTDAQGQTHPLSGDEVVSLNIWGFTPAIFAHLQQLFVEFLHAEGRSEKGEFYIPNAVGELIKRQQARVKVLSSQSPWFGVTYRDDKPRVQNSIQALVEQGIYPPNLWG